MILEAAVLNVRCGEESAFEKAFQSASALIGSSPGYRSHQLQRCVETKGRYLLLVHWETLEDHTVGFRQSAAYQQWKQQLHHFYNPFPLVEHYECVLQRSRVE
jgi:heme-degrading monooxygenase HmoA